MAEETHANLEQLETALNLPERQAVMQSWLDATRLVAEHSGLPRAQQLYDFLAGRAILGVAEPDYHVRFFLPQDTQHQEPGDSILVAPLLDQDVSRLAPDDTRQELIFADGDKSGALGRYIENSHVIYLTNRDLSPTSKGIVLLHEAMHAQLDMSGQLDRTVKDANWVEEKDIYLFEFELLRSLGGLPYSDLLSQITTGIAQSPGPKESYTLSTTYKVPLPYRQKFAEAMDFASEAETDLWLNFCTWNAFWEYFQKDLQYPEEEMVSFLKAKHADIATVD